MTMNVKRTGCLFLIVFVVVAHVLQAGETSGSTDVAKEGYVFVAPKAGRKLHALRTCSSLAKAKGVEEIAIATAVKRGKGKKWYEPCKFCLRTLSKHSTHKKKYQEFLKLATKKKPSSK